MAKQRRHDEAQKTPGPRATVPDAIDLHRLDDDGAPASDARAQDGAEAERAGGVLAVATQPIDPVAFAIPPEQPPPAVAVVAPKPTLLELAEREHQVRAEQRAEAQAADRADMVRAYMGLLLRNASPRPGDEAWLADLMRELQIKADDVKHHLEAIKRGIELAAQHDDKPAAVEAWRAEVQAYAALERRHREEERAAWRAKLNAQIRQTQAGEAHFHLGELAKRHPMLFETRDGIPRVRQIPEEVPASPA